MGKESFNHQVARWVAEKLDRVFGPKPKSEPPKNLSKNAQRVWAHTADTAVMIFDKFHPLNDSLILEEEVFLKEAIHERIIKDLKKLDQSQNPLLTEVEKWLEKRPPYLISLFAKQEKLNTEDSQIRERLTF
jgi:hypothetical protein